jgi:DUF4097 and DUF4098 domain-containing protein YvlB
MATAVLMSVIVAAAPGAQERPSKPPETDQTLPVTRGARLTVENYAGEVIVRTWSQDSLRVQARHSSRTRVNIRTTEAGILVRAATERGPSESVDYEITAPAWIPIRIDGHYNFATIEGAQGEVSVASVRGDIVIKGGTGTVTGKSIEGRVLVENARGRITVSSVNEAIRITGANGEISAETTNGDITMTRIESSSVEATTVNGDVTYDGTVANGGRYRITTHNGDITMTVPESSSATFSARTYNGDFSASTLPLKGPPRSEVRSGKRVVYTLGSGSAEVELESFGGAIRLRRPGASATGKDRER